jgi:hypothetical protein
MDRNGRKKVQICVVVSRYMIVLRVRWGALALSLEDKRSRWLCLAARILN